MVENLLAPSPTLHRRYAVGTIRRGPYAPLFWGAAIALGGLAPLALLIGAVRSGAQPGPIWIAAILALAGGAAWEYIWVEAGQSVPLS